MVKKSHSTAKPCKDHRGNEFGSKKEKCEYWGITYSAYKCRKRDGWTERKALTTPVIEDTKGVMSRDHTGNEFPTLTAMCKHYNITVQCYRDRIKAGWELKDALLGRDAPDYSVMDHLGNRYSSLTEMCAAYNISRSAYRERLKKGMSVEDALCSEKAVGQHLGKLWSEKDDNYLRLNVSRRSNKELAKHLKRTEAAVEARLSMLGLGRKPLFSKSNDKILMAVWGESREYIQKRLPKFTWKQIVKHATKTLGLEPLVVERDALRLHTVVKAFGYSGDMGRKWRKHGLPVQIDTNVDGSTQVYVALGDLWKFMFRNQELFDITRLPEWELGVEPVYIRQMRKSAVPKPRAVRPNKELRERAIFAHLYHGWTAEEQAKSLGIQVRSFKQAVRKYLAKQAAESTATV